MADNTWKLCEAAALVLSDDWQAFMEYRKSRRQERWKEQM